MRTPLIVSFFLIDFALFSQNVILKGIVKDELTLQPLREVNIKVVGSINGTSTDKSGNFSISLEKLPMTISLTCVGYEQVFYEINNISVKPAELLLRPTVYGLNEVDISTKNYITLFKDNDYSVLDYQFMDENILLLVFRYRLNKAELILLNRSGDTLAVSALPESPPASLYKDFMGNVHYISNGENTWQCFFDGNSDGIRFLYKTPVDTLKRVVMQFLFGISDRLYFRERKANGFGLAIGYARKGKDATYIMTYINVNKVSEFNDDWKFYSRWNGIMAGSNSTPWPEFSFGQYFDEDEARAHGFEFYNMTFPVIKTGERRITAFNFDGNVLEEMDEDGKILSTVPIMFHRESRPGSDTAMTGKLSDAGWRWGVTMLTDDYDTSIYTLFLRNGKVKVRQVDLKTGKLSPGTELPFPFPEKIKVFKGEAYFLYKGMGDAEKWKLVKCKL